MNQNNPEDVLLAVINKVLEFSGEGKQAKAQHILPFVYESVMQYPQLLWDNKEIWKIAKAGRSAPLPERGLFHLPESGLRTRGLFSR